MELVISVIIIFLGSVIDRLPVGEMVIVLVWEVCVVCQQVDCAAVVMGRQ